MFEVPVAKRSKGQDRFQFAIPGHEGRFSVRKLKFLSVGEREEVSGGGSPMVEFFCGATVKQREAVRSLDEEQFNALVAAWQEDSKVSMGESQASSS